MYLQHVSIVLKHTSKNVKLSFDTRCKWGIWLHIPTEYFALLDMEKDNITSVKIAYVFFTFISIK